MMKFKQLTDGRLSDTQAAKMIDKLLPAVQTVLVCNALSYVETKVFNEGEENESRYHIFAVINGKLGNALYQKATYAEATKNIEFTLWPIGL